MTKKPYYYIPGYDTQQIENMHRHHWNYNKDYWTDIIILNPSMHKKLHMKIKYDNEMLLFRDLDGNLLDSKQKHLDILNSIPYTMGTWEIVLQTTEAKS